MPDMAQEPLLEAVPNVSAGRDAAAVEAIGAAFASGGAALADVHRDADHDRSVFTLVGTDRELEASLVAGAREAVERIDLRSAPGVHPRVGALDVVPIVPLADEPLGPPVDAGSTDDEIAGMGPPLGDLAAAHACADRVARRIGTELDVPVVRYGLARDGAPLEGISGSGEARRGGPEAVAGRLAAGELVPIAGPAAPHQSAGITLVGVRRLLIAFNVDLQTDSLRLAREIAASIRVSTGGTGALPGVRALAFALASRGVVQVSTNIDSWTRCGPGRVLDRVAELAARHGTYVDGAELVGLAPRQAVGALRYACVARAVTLRAAPAPALEDAIAPALR